MKLVSFPPYVLFVFILSQMVSAQTTNVWREANHKAKLETKWDGVKTHRIALDQTTLNGLLMDFNQNEPYQIAIPHPLGAYMTFSIKPSHIMSKKLQDMYPEIKTFKGLNTKGDVLRFSITSGVIHGIVFTQDGTIMIEPESPESTNYVSYFKSDYLKSNNDKVTFYEETDNFSIKNPLLSKTVGSNDVFKKRSIGDQMKKYRIAIAAESGFTKLYGGKTKAMEAIVTILDLITGIFEKDLAITFELIANNDQLIYTSGSDPYSEVTPQFLQQLRIFNQEHLDDVIGFDNYDIGFLFSATGNNLGGQASTGQVCRQFKAAAMADFTTTVVQLGFSYMSTYVGHEIGHQFEALHSWSGRCSGTTNNPSTSSFSIRDAYEPGSGSTIMSYAGFCGDSNVENESDDYFHAISTEYMLSYIDRAASCATLVATGNTPPTVQIPKGGFVIPIDTPIMLQANGEDADGHVLTYCWEQFDQTLKQEHLKGYDIGPIVTREELIAEGWPETLIDGFLASQEEEQAALFEGDGPLFRSLAPTIENTRYLPQLDQVLTGDYTSNVEVLPFKTRDLNFVVTVRDNLGGMTNDLLSFSSSDQAGPFVVTSALTKPSYAGLSNFTVEWDVANTHTAPVNCKKIDILYSINGGKSFDIVLLENTDNDGFETIKLPNIDTSEARFMVKAADNIFFNVNDRDFTIISSEVPVPDAPTALTGYRLNGSSVVLSWTHAGDLENGFIIERKLASATKFEPVAQTPLNKITFTNTPVEASKTYEYRVAAFNNTGNSVYSNILTIETVKGTDILNFSVIERTGIAIINTHDHTILLEVASGTDRSLLIPTLKLLEGATSFPTSGVSMDFTKPVTYTVTAADGVTTQAWLISISEEATLAVDQVPADLYADLLIYPNPVTTALYLPTSLMNNITGIEIFDLTGKNVINYYSTIPTDKLNVSTLSSGFFIIKIITSDQQLIIRKFYKK